MQLNPPVRVDFGRKTLSLFLLRKLWLRNFIAVNIVGRVFVTCKKQSNDETCNESMSDDRKRGWRNTKVKSRLRTESFCVLKNERLNKFWLRSYCRQLIRQWLIDRFGRKWYVNVNHHISVMPENLLHMMTDCIMTWLCQARWCMKIYF